MLWLCNPGYIREVVLPAVREGRERVGKTLEGFEIVAAVPAAFTDDVAGAYAALRAELLTYFSLPEYIRKNTRKATFQPLPARPLAGLGPMDWEKGKEAFEPLFSVLVAALRPLSHLRAGGLCQLAIEFLGTRGALAPQPGQGRRSIRIILDANVGKAIGSRRAVARFLARDNQA